MEIKRDKYLQELIDRKHNGMVKVVTGIRRCGKSYLLFKLYYDYLISIGVNKEQIITIALDNVKNMKFRNPLELDKFITEQISDNSQQFYVFIDEIQFVKKEKNPYVEDDYVTFYDVLNGLLNNRNVDIYVTGSNSKMLSKDILTEFRGRGDEIRVMPLTFLEFMQVFDGDRYDGWLEYYTFGGLPAIVERKTQEQKVFYLTNLFQETYIKDIIERNHIKYKQELNDLLNILSSGVGSLTNPSKLENTFKSVKNVNFSRNTIDNYLEYFEDAFLIQKVNRYNIKGKKYINTLSKYYFTDIGLRNARLNFRQQEETHIMENIIYNELIYRGFNVDIGIVEINERQQNNHYIKKQIEVDFVANKGNKRYYIQSAFALPTFEKREQEERPLNNINDSFKKIIVVKERTMLKRDDKGIVTMDIFDFLLNPNSLDL